MKKECHCFFRYLQLIIFVSYFGCISFFTHSHIVNGVTIVHSHPFSQDRDGNPSHTHNSVELVLFHQLNTFHSDGEIIDTIIINGEDTKNHHEAPILYQNHLILSEYLIVHTLRPPPVG